MASHKNTKKGTKTQHIQHGPIVIIKNANDGGSEFEVDVVRSQRGGSHPDRGAREAPAGPTPPRQGPDGRAAGRGRLVAAAGATDADSQPLDPPRRPRGAAAGDLRRVGGRRADPAASSGLAEGVRRRLVAAADGDEGAAEHFVDDALRW